MVGAKTEKYRGECLTWYSEVWSKDIENANMKWIEKDEQDPCSYGASSQQHPLGKETEGE